MKNLKIFYYKRALTCLILLFSLTANPGIFAQEMDCTMIIPDEEDSVANRPTESSSCEGSSTIYNDFFRYQTSYIPTNGITTKENVNKMIRLRFVIVEKNNTGSVQTNFRPADIGYLGLMMFWLNNMMSSITPPSNPVTSQCGACHITDERFRVAMEEVVFINDPNSYTDRIDTFYYRLHNSALHQYAENDDHILNVFMYVDSLRWQPEEHPDLFTGGASATYGGDLQGPEGTRNLYAYMHNTYLAMVSYPLHYPNTTDSGVIWSETLRLYHELHHSLGLGHLNVDTIGNIGFERTGCSGIDYLADAFPNGCPMLYQDDSTINIMNRHGWSNHLTPMQIGRAHRNAHLGRVSKYILPMNSPGAYPWNVSSNQVWDFPIRLFQDLIVKSGSTLTIKCLVQMPPESSVIIEPGAKLIIDGGKLTSYRNDRSWRGIWVTGDETLPFTPANQGVLEVMNGAIIENAEIAINNSPLNVESGGIVVAENSTIKNCLRGIIMTSFDKDYKNGGYNQWRFKNMDFLLENNHIFNSHPPQDRDIITISNVKSGVSFNNCRFLNQLPYLENPQYNRYIALNIFSSGVNISNSTLKGFTKGIYSASHIGFPRSMDIHKNSFDSITDNITIAANALASIKGNTIQNMRKYTKPIDEWTYLERNPVGIYLDNSRFTHVRCNNKIYGVPGSNGGDLFLIPETFGLIANNTSSYGSLVISNTFEDLGAAVQTQYNNPGLDILCNTFTDNNRAIRVNPESTGPFNYLKNQGSGCSSGEYTAANKFNGNHRAIESYIYHNWNYYHSLSAMDHTPNNSSGSVTVHSCLFDNNIICDGINDCIYPIEPFALNGEVFSEYESLKQEHGIHFPGVNSLFQEIVHAYNATGDYTGLQSFLESESRENPDILHLLVPLYLDRADYSKMNAAIGELPVPEEDKQAYRSYYTLLAGLKQSRRTIEQINDNEQQAFNELAEGEFTISAHAKALLEKLGSYEWVHYIENNDEVLEEIATTLSRDSSAVKEVSHIRSISPNPAGHVTYIHSYVTPEQISKGHQVMINIRSIHGNVMQKINLAQPGENISTVHTENWLPGVYYVNLIINDQVTETKILSIL